MRGYLRMWRQNLAALVIVVTFVALLAVLPLLAYFKDHGGP